MGTRLGPTSSSIPAHPSSGRSTLTDKGRLSSALLSCRRLRFSELVRLLERNGFQIVKEKGAVRYYGKVGWDGLIRVDYHGSKEVPTGTCHAILKAAGLREAT